MGFNRYVSYERFCDSARADRDDEDYERMQGGPFYDDKTGTLRIPSYFYSPVKTPKANTEWRRRGLHYDGLHREWFCKIAPAHAGDQVAKARTVFNGIWHFQD